MEWVEIDTHHKLQQGMFVAKVEGRSMEPQIRDGSYCLFLADVTGTRQGKIFLVELRDAMDPDTGDRYTVKRYSSEKGADEDGTWRHVKIILSPQNPDYSAIEIVVEDEMDVKVIAEFVEVLGSGDPFSGDATVDDAKG